MLKNQFAEQGFPVTGGGVHLVDGNAGADGGKGVPGKIQVRHGIHRKGILVLHGVQIVSQFPALHPQLTFTDTRHHRCHHFPVRHPGKIIGQHAAGSVIPDTGFIQKLADEVLPHLVIRDGLCHQIQQIHNLHALTAQAIRKGIVFPLRLFQIRDVIKQQLFQIFRHQVLQFHAGAVQHHFPQPPNFRRIMDSRFQSVHSF